MDRLARAQDGHAVADMQHLAHLVADEDDALALCLELVDDCIEAFDLDVGESCGRFVENEQFRAAIERLENLHALLRANGYIGDLCFEVDV
ncbi:hypothetical protein SDC9_127821 [bioreactor metagenome]|uniref:Uncharacterized protein n=1 Tax=bioreactor metagenome TaxID=1076179 RepID=A0A645CV41_9ZZZZ